MYVVSLEIDSLGLDCSHLNVSLLKDVDQGKALQSLTREMF